MSERWRLAASRPPRRSHALALHWASAAQQHLPAGTEATHTVLCRATASCPAAEFHAPGKPDEPLGSVVLLEDTSVESANSARCYAEPSRLRRAVRGDGIAENVRLAVKGTVQGDVEPDCTGKKDGDKVEVRALGNGGQGDEVRVQGARHQRQPAPSPLTAAFAAPPCPLRPSTPPSTPSTAAPTPLSRMPLPPEQPLTMTPWPQQSACF